MNERRFLLYASSIFAGISIIIVALKPFGECNETVTCVYVIWSSRYIHTFNNPYKYVDDIDNNQG